jgi:hypothetical protein
MIPPFDPSSGLLPPGVHEATWEEFVARFGWTPRRLALLAGLKAALDALRVAGCRRAYIDGSFVTAKDTPGDFDGCWEVEGVDLAQLDPVLKTFANFRAVQKQKYGGELFPADAPADLDGTNFLRFFQRDKGSGAAKGIVALELGVLP